MLFDEEKVINSSSKEGNRISHRPTGVLRDYVAQAIEVVQNGTLGRIYKSAPTSKCALYQHTISCKYSASGFHKFDGVSG